MAEPDNIELRSFEDVARDFLKRWQVDLEKEEEWFGKRPKSLDEAISRAALSQIPSRRGGRLIRHSHQTRLSNAVLIEAKRHLFARKDEIERCQNFEELFDLVERTVLHIPGVGEMLVYDIAQRLGIYLEFQPTKVYMHRGTRVGAIKLGLEAKSRAIPIEQFPPALGALGAYRLEDVLCIYRATLGRIAAGASGRPPKSRC